MPVIYEIDSDRGLIHTRCVGAVTIQEVLGHFAALTADPKCPPVLNVLLDMTEQTLVPGSQQIKMAAAEVSRIRARVKFERCAILATNESLIATGLIFKTFAAGQFEKVAVFESEDLARSWLESGEHPVGAEPGVWQ